MKMGGREAARAAGAKVEYLRGAFGEHGFGLKRFWARPCARWLAEQGFGDPGGAPDEAGADFGG